MITRHPHVSDDPIDRITPTVRPAARTIMRQRWSNLLFLHWIVDDTQIRPLLPPGVELDTFEGRAYVGLVPFTMTGVRPWWSPALPFVSSFHETNVRTYVHRNGADPGVWFFSLDAASSLAVRVARGAWKLPYHRAIMRMSTWNQGNLPNTDLSVEYQTERVWPGPVPAKCKVNYSVIGPPQTAVPKTLEHFLTERYLLYACRDGVLFRGQVHHVPYPLQQVTISQLDENMITAAGIAHGTEVPLAHYASELNVRIYPLKKIST